MKLDLLYEIDVPRPWPGDHPVGQRRAEQQAYREALEQIRVADPLGFATVWLVEHHFREGRSHCPAPEVVLGALSPITSHIRLGFGVTLTPPEFCHPARVAEKVAAVDVLSGGRVEWGIGRSTPMEQLAFGVDRERSKENMFEAARTIAGMWREERYERHDEFLEFPSRLVTPKPVQDPHPPPWMAATSDGSAAQAGAHGFGLLSFSIMQPIERMARHIAEYRQAAAGATPLTDVGNDRVAAYTLVHCADSMDQAEANGIWDAVWWWYQNLAEFTLQWELPHFSQEERDAVFPLLTRNAEGRFTPSQFNDADMIIVGDPERCLEKMLHYADLGVDQLICYVQFGHLPHESVIRTIELLGSEVIPELEKRGHRVDMRAAEPASATTAA